MKFDFLNKEGEKLSGRFEVPKGPIKATAIFAHCFTCSKNVMAASAIAKALTDSGIGVLRFDFTGLGASEGDFANTNFSSNVDDLLRACAAMEKDFEHPQLIIGHSLGGAAVLKAAASLPKVKAVVTIGAPSDVAHVSHLFSEDIETIKTQGEAEVCLAGRPFKIKKQFIDDLKELEILDGVSKMKKAYLNMHAPTDDTVSIDHAAKLFVAAKHPKSFVSLDSANHLLSNKKDAEYAASVIGSWAKRYLDLENKERPNVEAGEVHIKARVQNKFTQDVYTKTNHIVADEPRSYKGDDLGMSPYELLLAGLGACTSMTVKMYADRKNIKLTDIDVKLKHTKIHAKDCEECETESGKVDQIEKAIFLKGEFTPEQEKRMHEIAEMCPVNKTLLGEINVVKSQ